MKQLGWLVLTWFMLFAFADLWHWAHEFPMWSLQRIAIELAGLVLASIAIQIYASKAADD